MTITEVRVLTLRGPGWALFDAARSCAPGGWRSICIVEVHTDAGLIGFGEAAGRPEVIRAIIEKDLAPMLVGQDPMHIERLWATQWSRMLLRGRTGYVSIAMGGIDIALWDLKGKAVGLPVYKLLGGFADRIPAYYSGGFYAVGKGIPELQEEARSALAKGFQMMKMKVARSPSELYGDSEAARATLKDDLARVAAVREVLGPDRLLMVDANCVWDVATAIRMGREFETLGVYWLEEPVATEDVTGSAQVAAALDIRVAGYETQFTRTGFRDLIIHRAVDIVQPDVIIAGGFTECRKIAAMAEAFNVPCTPHASSSSLATVCNAHLIAALPHAGPLEYCQLSQVFFDDLLTEPPTVDKEGYYSLPQRPGLGVELNPDTVAKYRID